MSKLKRALLKDMKKIESEFKLKTELTESTHLKLRITDGLRTATVVSSKTSRNYETRKKTVGHLRRNLRDTFGIETKQTDFTIDYAPLMSSSRRV